MTFKEMVNGDKPVLLDFYAEWCGPCKAMNPILKDLHKSMGDDARIIKIDVDKNQGLAQKLGVRGVPTLMIYKKGKMMWREAGMRSKAELEGLLKNMM